MRATHTALPAVALLAAAAHAAPGFFPLGNTGNPPNGGSAARAISSGGHAAAGRVSVTGGRIAFRWAQGDGMVALGDAPGGPLFPAGRGISADGAAVIGANISPAAVTHAAIWRFPGATFTDLGDLDGGADSSVGTSLSYDGDVAAGFSESTNGTQAFRWSDTDGMTPLGDLKGGLFASIANGISGDGRSIVGAASSAASTDGFEPMRWTQAQGMVGLGFLDGATLLDGEANAASLHATVIVGRSGDPNNEYQAFRWTPAGMQPLGYIGPANPNLPHNSTAYGVSSDGETIVGETTTDDGLRAFIWDTTHAMRLATTVMANAGISLPAGWVLLRAYAISPGGLVFAGQGTNPAGIEEAWILRLPLAGDTNADDVVNFTDLNIVLSNYGMTGPPGTIPGDVNNDGAVNFSDLNIVLSNFGVEA